MTKETLLRIGKLWKLGKWNKNDFGAKEAYERFKSEIDAMVAPPVEEPEPETKPKKKLFKK